MSKNLLFVLVSAISVSLFFISGCQAKIRTTRLTRHEAIQAAPSLKATRDAIISACKKHDWAITNDKPGELRISKLAKRKHEMNLLVTYDKNGIQLQYISSRNLKYRKERNGDEYIHNNYFVWVDTLRFEIKKGVSEALLATPTITT